MCRLPANSLPCLRTVLGLLLVLSSVAGCGRPRSDGERIAAARQDQLKGEPKAAIIELRNVLQAHPTNGAARALLGQLYLERGDALAAEKELRHALELHMDPTDIWPQLGLALLLTGQVDRLLEQLPADTRRPELQALRARALLGQNHPEQARAAFEQILERTPGQSGALLGLAALALRVRQQEEALALIERALAAHPEDTDALRMRGELLRMQGKPEAALQSYFQVIKLRPQHPLAHLDIASIYLQTGKLAEAKTQLALARDASPNSVLVAYTQAMLDFQEHHLPAALEQLQLVLRADPVLNDLARSHPQLREKRALDEAERALQLAPGNAYVLDTLATILQDRGQPARALPLLKQASGLAPTSAEIRYHYGLGLLKAGDKQGARAQLAPLLAEKDFGHRNEVRALLAQL